MGGCTYSRGSVYLKPVLVGLLGSCEELHRNFVQNIARETTNHAKEGELLEMEQGFAR